MTSARDAATLAFYAGEAAVYAARSDNIGVSKALANFLTRLPRKATVLDLGCGTGRDELGRYYNYLNAEELTAALNAAGMWTTVDLHEGPGVGYDRKEAAFIACTARKT